MTYPTVEERKMSVSHPILVLMALVVVTLASMADARSAVSHVVKAPARIHIAGDAFQPAALTVTAGSKVTWTNADDDPHTVTAQGSFDSGGLAQGDSYSRTFRTPGRYIYFCKVHPFMKGVIVVTSVRS